MEEPVTEPIRHYTYKPHDEHAVFTSQEEYFPPISQEARTQEEVKAVGDREAISMEIEFGSKWLQYIGIIVIATTFILLGLYSIRYMTPLQENLLIYASAFILLGFGEYLYRAKDMELYGKGLVFGGFLVVYIAAWSSHYTYDLIDFSVFILLVALFISFNLILGFRYDSNFIMFQGLVCSFVLISNVRIEEYVDPLGYGLLLPAVTALGSIVVFLRKNTEYILYLMVISYMSLILSVFFLDNFILIPLTMVTVLITLLVFLHRRYEEGFSPFMIIGVNIQYPLYLFSLFFAYLSLLTMTFFTWVRSVGNLMEYDPWAFLVFLFTLQLIYNHKFGRRKDDFISTLALSFSLMAIGILTANIGYSIYIYLSLIVFVLILNYDLIFKGEHLISHTLLIILMLCVGRLMIYLRYGDTITALDYYLESLLILYVLSFGFLNQRFMVKDSEVDKKTYPVSPILFPLLVLYFASSPDLLYSMFIIPVVLLSFSYKNDDAVTFNCSYLLIIYSIYNSFSFGDDKNPEIFLLSSMILFTIALAHEFADRKKDLAMGTAVISSILLLISSLWIFEDDVITTIIWVLFGIVSIMLGLSLNRYYLRWMGLSFILISTVKAYSVDISVLSLEMKILSFALLGFILLIISYIYTRYKAKLLNTFGLKEKPEPPPPPTE